MCKICSEIVDEEHFESEKQIENLIQFGKII